MLSLLPLQSPTKQIN
uniref:Uncharacterized protein n=1 Tax=Arundo donax TaxID=35708 RepID=A0A0A9CHD4_ARUDO